MLAGGATPIVRLDKLSPRGGAQILAKLEYLNPGGSVKDRIGLPASASLPPFVDWPEDLTALVRGEVVMLEGGHEYDGRPIVPFDTAGMRAAAPPVQSFAAGRRR